MAKTKDTTTTSLALPDAAAGPLLAPAVAQALALGGNDRLAEIEGYDQLEIEDDGLGELGIEDVKLPVKIWNAAALDSDGNPIPKNKFFDTVTEEVQSELNVIPVKDHITNEWREYDEATGKGNVRCASFDRVTGAMDDGTIRKCEGCPDAKWENVQRDDGRMKRTRRCGPVHNVFAAELVGLKPCVIRYKRTSLTVIQNYWSRYHFMQRSVRDKRTGKISKVNYPAFALGCRITLRMSDDKKYAIPVMECLGELPLELIAQGNETCKYVNAVLMSKLPKAVESEMVHATVVDEDTSFDTSKMGTDGGMGGGAGQDFVESPAAE